MSPFIYQPGNALPANSPCYIKREADSEARALLHQMEYIALLDARQQGKTSLINNLIGQFQSPYCTFVYVDLSTLLGQTTEAAWYQALCGKLLQQIIPISADAARLAPPTNALGWDDFLMGLAKKAQTEDRRLVIALDEVGCAPEPWATGFFSVLRSVLMSRQTRSFYKSLTFIIAAACNPTKLISNPLMSPFNVAHRVILQDFNEEQVRQLVEGLQAGASADAIAERLYYWTSGQPYMCQWLCSTLAKLGSAIMPTDVDEAVQTFIAQDINHLPQVSRSLHADKPLLKYARRVIAHQDKLSPSTNEKDFQLCSVIGLLSLAKDRTCRIRNRIYEEAFKSLLAQHT